MSNFIPLPMNGKLSISLQMKYLALRGCGFFFMYKKQLPFIQPCVSGHPSHNILSNYMFTIDKKTSLV